MHLCMSTDAEPVERAESGSLTMHMGMSSDAEPLVDDDDDLENIHSVDTLSEQMSLIDTNDDDEIEYDYNNYYNNKDKMYRPTTKFSPIHLLSEIYKYLKNIVTPSAWDCLDND